jgi:hypothetical protein
MAETFLEEQLERIRRLTEQMSQVRSRAAELSNEFERDRAMIRRSPLQDVRDFRRHPSISETPDRTEDHGGRSTARSASRRRR